MVPVKQILMSVMLACTIQMSLAITPFAQINNSRITGKTITVSGTQVNEFLGIPFADPPLKELRFQKPKAIQNYPKIFQADKARPACRQYMQTWFPGLVTDPEKKSEDCLYLNVWTPIIGNEITKNAVLYWIHGGDFRFGQAFDGKHLAAMGNIIVVTINYRLGYFGSFTSNTPDAPGDVGLWDILEGLRWVNKYIPAFGGDVSRITIGGSGAGAISVGLLSISPLSKGLYARQIMESGSPAYLKADNKKQNIQFSQQLYKLMGCVYRESKRVVNCMKFLQYADGLADTIELLDAALSANVSYTFVPSYGTEILPENPRLLLVQNKFRCTDLLIGSNIDEGGLRATGVEFRDNPLNEFNDGKSMIRKSLSYFPDPEAIVDYYLPPSLQNANTSLIRKQVQTAIGDTEATCPTVYYAEKCAEQKKNVYYYYSAAETLPDGFNHLMEIVLIWSNFVKYGKPIVLWPLYSKQSPVFKYIGLNRVTGTDIVPDKYDTDFGPNKQNCDFLRPIFGF